MLLNETERNHFSATLFLWCLLFLVDVLLVLVASLPSTCPCPPELRIVVAATVLLSVLGHFPIVFPGQRRGKIFGLYRPDGAEICLCLKRDEKSCNTLCTVLQCPDFAEPWTISIREREKIIGRQRKKESFAFSCSKLSVRGHLKST